MRPIGAIFYRRCFWTKANRMDDLVKSFDYDVFGNLVATEDELGGTVFSDHDALGNTVETQYDFDDRVVVQSGATYPVRYVYDTLGRMSALSTTRDGTVWDTTLWRYDFATGLATNKVYADNSVIAYTFTPDGKPYRTTWARGMQREYAYNSDGLPATTTYSDDAPAVSFAYDAFQRLAAASNAVAVYVYAMDTLGAVTNETATIGTRAHMLTRDYDEFHRFATLTTADETVRYDYDAESRLTAVSNAVFSPSTLTRLTAGMRDTQLC